MSDNDRLADAIARRLPEAQAFLEKLISFPSTPGKEHELMLWLEGAVKDLGAAIERVPLDNSLRDDPDYSSPLPDIDYAGRFNLRLRLSGRAPGRILLFNTHLDVVPPSQGQTEPWTPRRIDGTLYGRGACDAKGQAATLYLLLAVLRDTGGLNAGEIRIHFVNEEENGGNGTLAMIRRGESADGCIVLEPTDGRILSSVRGAVWFRLRFEGKPGHSGRAGSTVSALGLARKAMDALERYHAELLARSRGQKLFDQYPNPMPLTFGRCAAGDWPATAPARAVVEGVLGFLPGTTRATVMEELRQTVANALGPEHRERAEVEFMYRHEGHATDPEHPLVQTLLDAHAAVGAETKVDAMTASCDSWFYSCGLGIPAVVYGPGSLGFAHSNEEQIRMEEIGRAARVLAETARRWCGATAEEVR